MDAITSSDLPSTIHYVSEERLYSGHSKTLRYGYRYLLIYLADTVIARLISDENALPTDIFRGSKVTEHASDTHERDLHKDVLQPQLSQPIASALQ